MGSIINYNSLEIVYLYKPMGIEIPTNHLSDISVSARNGELDELNNLYNDTNKLYLYVLTPAQYAGIQNNLEKTFETKLNSNSIGFFLIEDPSEIATIRLRKKITAKENSITWILGNLKFPYNYNEICHEIQKASSQLFLTANQDLYNSMLHIREIEAKSINEIGMAVMSQSTTENLMKLILDKAVGLSDADAGFLFLEESLFHETHQTENRVKLLRKHGGNLFVLKSRVCKSQTVRIHPDILNPHKSQFTSLVINRMCGISWNQGMENMVFHEAQNIQYSETNYIMPELDFDDKTYAIKSLCAFPLRTPSQEAVGYVLLINRKESADKYLDSLQDIENWVGTFGAHDISILEALSNQAGVSIDHTRLYKDLKTVFESFVTASVVAIESRDPTTKGHSERVAILTNALAESINEVHYGPYANLYFTPTQLYELKYAALLHDFGKIGVREDILMKEKKLYDNELSAIQSRFFMIENSLKIQIMEKYIQNLLEEKRPPTPNDILNLKNEVNKISSELESYYKYILDANEPHVVNTFNFHKIAEIAAIKIKLGNSDIPLLTPYEKECLSIKKGSLSYAERMEIESHVTHSYRFLLQIPWTSDLANIPDIVYTHHERLDGSGYPRHVTNDEIPVQAKIMAITDIYDALVAMDRPYKKAIPRERALNILDSEVKEGKIDKNLFQIFIDYKIADRVIYAGIDDLAASA